MAVQLDPSAFSSKRVNGGQVGHHFGGATAPGRHDLMAGMAHMAANLRPLAWRREAHGGGRGISGLTCGAGGID
jgi:hypothetical protein